MPLTTSKEPIRLSEGETAALMRAAGHGRGLHLIFGIGWAALCPERSAWAIPVLMRMRHLILEDGAGI